MGGIRYVPVLILTALLFFGCLGSPQAPPAGGAPSNGGPTAPSDGSGPAAPSDDGTPEAPTQPEQPSDSLEGLGYEALLALGQSIECDITTTDYEGHVMTMKVYMKGSDNVRSEFNAITESTCPRYVSIYKDGISYVGCEGGEMFEGSSCDWLKMVPDPSEPADTSSAGFEQPVLDDVPPANINCKLWAYNSAKFDTPGKACTMDELMQAMYAGYGDYSDYQ